jgi:hypothetical protein
MTKKVAIKRCEHNKQRSTCKECKGSAICEHDKQRSTCKECKGSSICEHDKQRSTCKECKGSSICEHDRLKNQCKECKGSAICEHDKQRSQCKECKGSSICEHDKIRSSCKECKGTSICEHERQRSDCKKCNGSSICTHNRKKLYCNQCSPVTCDYPLCEHLSSKGSIKQHKKTHTPEYQQRKKKKEQAFADFLDANNITYQREVVVDYTCVTTAENKRHFVDFVVYFNNQVFFIEVDETQHSDKDQSCETSRMLRIVESLTIGGNTTNIIFIRFNPDTFKENGKTTRVPLKERHATILHLIQTIVTDRPFSVIYKYYNTIDERLVIMDDDDFPDVFERYILQIN